MIDTIFILLYLWRLVLQLSLSSILENLLCALVKNAYSTALGCNVVSIFIKTILPECIFSLLALVDFMPEYYIH